MHDQKKLGFYLFCKASWFAALAFREFYLGALPFVFKLHTHVIHLYA